MPLGDPIKLIRLSKSCLSGSEKMAVMGVLDREFLGMGEEVRQFETALSDFFKRPAVCVSNGTAALQLALESVDIGYGDEVLVPSLTYVASFQAIAATGAKPVACDVRSKDLILDWRDAAKRITKNTKAIMPVHYSGGVGNLDEIYTFAEKYGLRVIEDAAHAFGTVFDSKLIGSFGDIACFSFDGIKNITSGEGGCVVTDDIKVLSRIRDSRLLGVMSDTEKRYTGQRSWEFSVSAQGWRYHMSNIMASIGLEQLKRFPEMLAIRQSLAKEYDNQLKGHPRIHVIEHDYSNVVPHIYVIQISGLTDRQRLQESLSMQGIQTGIHYQPNHRLDYFKQSNAIQLPVTEKVFNEILTLPLHVDLTVSDIKYVSQALKELLK